jgi:hypothetical protein
MPLKQVTVQSTEMVVLVAVVRTCYTPSCCLDSFTLNFCLRHCHLVYYYGCGSVLVYIRMQSRPAQYVTWLHMAVAQMLKFHCSQYRKTIPATITFLTFDDPACSLCLKLNFSARVLHGNGKTVLRSQITLNFVAIRGNQTQTLWRRQFQWWALDLINYIMFYMWHYATYYYKNKMLLQTGTALTNAQSTVSLAHTTTHKYPRVFIKVLLKQILFAFYLKYKII